MEYLGLIIDTVSLSWSFPQLKVESTISLCNSILDQDDVKLRDLASIFVVCLQQFRSLTAIFGPYRPLTFVGPAFLGTWTEEYHFHPVLVTTFADVYLIWYFQTGKPDPGLTNLMDASLEEWDVVCDGTATRGPWLS